MQDRDITTSASHSTVWDIETAPLPASYLDLIAPEFEAPSNYKDESKIEAYKAEQKLKWMDRAALSPLTGRVLCIGVQDLDGSFVCIDGGGDEAALLTQWAEFTREYKNETFIGFNTHSFDIPFLTKRAWKLGVKPFMRPGVNLRYLENWVDLRDVWQMGDRQAEGSLDAIAKYLGVGAKNGEGRNFHLLWENDHETALAYLQNDLTITKGVGEKLGVIV